MEFFTPIAHLDQATQQWLISFILHQHILRSGSVLQNQIFQSYCFLPFLILSYRPAVAIYCYISKEIFFLYGDNFILNYFSGQTLQFNKGLEHYTKSIVRGIKITYQLWYFLLLSPTSFVLIASFDIRSFFFPLMSFYNIQTL